MKLTSIPHRIYRNANRAREVIAVLIKYGLADGFSQLPIEFAKDLFKGPSGDPLARNTRATRIRQALSELGPTFIKLGQILSTRPELVGLELAAELQKLQEDAPADSPEAARATIETELGQPLEELFAEFDELPLASASIGQVHHARLLDGQAVVVKVQHAGIETKIRTDLEIILGLAQLVEMHPDFKNYRPTATAAEFQRTLLRELDFGREERNLQQFTTIFRDDPRIHVPRSYPELSTPRVLTMERLHGIKLAEADRLIAEGFDLRAVARVGAEVYVEMIFNHGFYHADPHPGNIVLLPGNVIGLLDFGMVGRIDEQLREEIEEMLMAISNQDASHLTSIIMRVGEVPPDLDEASLSLDVHEFIEQYAACPVDELNLSAALHEMTEIIRRFQIMLPARMGLLIKVLVMLEGTSRLLNPSFSLMEVLTPYQNQMMWRRLSPARHVRKLRRLYAELEHLAHVLPRGVVDILQQVRSGKFDVHLDHRGLEPSVNRLVLGMLTSALFLGSALLLSRNFPPVINLPPVLPDISVLGLMGCTVSIALGLRLLWAIRKSGRLDRHE